MIKRTFSKSDLEYIKNQKDDIIDIIDLLDHLPKNIWFGDDNGGISYELAYIPYGRTGDDISTWSIAYLVEDDDYPPCIVNFSSNSGILEAAMKMYIWIKEYTKPTKYLPEITFKTEKEIFNAMTTVNNKYKNN